jgi:hypothetical protein
MTLRSSVFATVLLLSYCSPARAQQQAGCGSTNAGLSPELVARALAADAERGGGNEVRTMKLHVVIAAAPNGGFDPVLAFQPSDVQRDIDATNAIFARCNTGVQLQLCGPIEVVVDQQLYISPLQAAQTVQANTEPGYINAFYVFDIASGTIGGAALGDLVFVSRFGPQYTLAHEVGHVLGLSHPHDVLIEPELVNGSNCTIGGDMLCDTPADPRLDLPGMMLPPCTYVGTVTDANGDLYTPMLNNLMSYTLCTADSLTPQQGALMRYTADNVRVQLQRTTSPTIITPFALRQCVDADPLALEASPAPGTFSGPLVSGTNIINAPNPPGQYWVAYSPTAQEPPTVFADQFCLPYALTPTAHIGVATDSVWQSFTAAIDGEFDRLDIYALSTAPQNMRLRIYSGEGVGGSLLFDLSAPMTADTSWTLFDLPGGVNSLAGNTYTALVTTATDIAIMTPYGASYAHGISSLGPQDVEFRQWILAAPPCQGTYRYYELYQVQEHPFINLADAYCHSDERPVHLVADTLHLSNISEAVDGSTTDTFIPSNLAPGEHLAQHTYTVNGCSGTMDQVFTVEPPPTFVFPALQAPICVDNDPIPLQGEPAGGSFRINGAASTVLDPAALGVGTHTVDYLYSTVLDEVTFQDQFCCYEGLPSYGFLPADSLAWQAFNARQTGTLLNIQTAVLMNANVARTFNLSLHEGTGPDGPVIWSDTRTTLDGYNLFTTLDLPVQEGSTYSWALQFVADAEPMLPNLFHFTANGYPTGLGHMPGVPDADLFFREVIRQSFPCADSTSFTINVDVCSGIAGSTLPGISVGPNPFGRTLLLTTAGERVFCTLLSADGRTVRTHSAGPHTREEIPVADLASGCYLLRLSSADGARTEVLRVVRE